MTDSRPGKWVLGRHNRGTWIDSDDPENVNCVVVKLKKGISQRERNGLSDDDSRKRLFTSGNNLVPYSFHTFGPDNFFGQTITLWQPIEEAQQVESR